MTKDNSKENDIKVVTNVKKVEEVKEKPRTKGYYVCKNKAITSKRGLKGPGDRVEESDMCDGKETLDRLLKKKLIEII